tara:strand:+ start:155 stop:346 length:192 start_codon:yes stop_codon:yes gene_type:complete
MISLPKRKQLLPKICKDCGVPVNKDNGIMSKGYLVRHCRKCRNKQISRWNKKRSDAEKATKRF